VTARTRGLSAFTEAISFVVNCEAQEEIDTFWEKLSVGEQRIQCGWLKDKLLQDKDQERTNRVLNAELQMTKIDIQRLQQASER
jgi:predicted 3-demethylubiquinone-9 3-methyltransferase (glyoxalase superfamily)